MSSTVIATLSAQDIERHREALIAWAQANGLDPHAIALAPGVTIERTGRRTVICYEEFQRDAQGQALVDPADPRKAWTIKRAAPLRVPLPALDDTSHGD